MVPGVLQLPLDIVCAAPCVRLSQQSDLKTMFAEHMAPLHCIFCTTSAYVVAEPTRKHSCMNDFMNPSISVCTYIHTYTCLNDPILVIVGFP